MRTKGEVFAFEVRVANTSWSRIINAPTAGRAKRLYHQDVMDAWPDIPFTAIRVRKLGPAHTSEAFKCNAKYRGRPDIRCGQRVAVNGAMGTITGHNESANFNVLFDDDAPRYAGLTLNVHPQDVKLV